MLDSSGDVAAMDASDLDNWKLTPNFIVGGSVTGANEDEPINQIVSFVGKDLLTVLGPNVVAQDVATGTQRILGAENSTNASNTVTALSSSSSGEFVAIAVMVREVSLLPETCQGKCAKIVEDDEVADSTSNSSKEDPKLEAAPTGVIDQFDDFKETMNTHGDIVKKQKTTPDAVAQKGRQPPRAVVQVLRYRDGVIRKELNVYGHENAAITSVTWGYQENWLVAFCKSGNDGIFTVWTHSTGEMLSTLTVPLQHEQSVNVIRVVPCIGHHRIIATGHSLFRVWDLVEDQDGTVFIGRGIIEDAIEPQGYEIVDQVFLEWHTATKDEEEPSEHEQQGADAMYLLVLATRCGSIIVFDEYAIAHSTHNSKPPVTTNVVDIVVHTFAEKYGTIFIEVDDYFR
jgi:hypothetical protein